jgi:hypothetical protein
MKLNQRKLSGEAKARASIKPGTYLYGYCGGRFGRDSHGDKLVLKVYEDYLEVQEEDGTLNNSLTINSWVDLVNSSNSFLEEECREGEE